MICSVTCKYRYRKIVHIEYRTIEYIGTKNASKESLFHTSVTSISLLFLFSFTKIPLQMKILQIILIFFLSHAFMQFSIHSPVSLLKKIKVAPDRIKNLLILYVQNTLEDEVYS